MTNERYFAHLEGEEFLDAVYQKIRDYYDSLEQLGLKTLYQQSYKAYYGGDLTSKTSSLFDSIALGKRGEQGEFTTLKQNDYRRLITYIKSNVTSQRPAVTTRAINGDYKSQAQAVLGKNVVDYYLKEKGVESLLNKQTEYMCVFSEGNLHHPWNPSKGEVIDNQDGTVVHEGDVDFEVGTPLSLIRDTTALSLDQSDFKIWRTTKNKWDLVAEHNEDPELVEAILSISSDEDFDSQSDFDIKLTQSRANTDKIPYYYFYHKKTPAIPEGRLVIFIKTAILFDGPLPYEKIPINTMRAAEITDTPYSYSQAWELLASQNGLDLLNNTLMSNNASLGVQSLWQKKGDTPDVINLQGMRVFISEEAPQPIQLTQSAPETYNLRSQIKNDMESLIGTNQTAMGNPAGANMSGSAMALLVSQALSFSSDLEAAYNSSLEEIGTSIINHLKVFSISPRNIVISGVSNRSYQKDLYKEDIQFVSRVVVERTNPLAKTVSGRLQMAQDMMQNGFIKTPEEYIMVLTTGQLDSALFPAQNKMLAIRAENEALLEGKPVQAVISENHADHIREHLTLIESPQNKEDPELVQRVLDHVQEHLNLWYSASPALLMITGQQPPPPDPNRMQQPSQNAPESPADLTQLPPEANPQEMMPEQPNMPNLPAGTPEQLTETYENQINAGEF